MKTLFWLEDYLASFKGAILTVSHDRYFIRALAGKILELENGEATEFTGNYDEYTAFKRSVKEKAVETPSAPVKTSEHKESYYRTKEERAQDAKRRTRIKRIEDEISALELEDEELNADLTKPEITANFALLTKKCNRLEEIKNRLDELYAEYETLI